MIWWDEIFGWFLRVIWNYKKREREREREIERGKTVFHSFHLDFICCGAMKRGETQSASVINPVGLATVSHSSFSPRGNLKLEAGLATGAPPIAVHPPLFTWLIDSAVSVRFRCGFTGRAELKEVKEAAVARNKEKWRFFKEISKRMKGPFHVVPVGPIATDELLIQREEWRPPAPLHPQNIHQ